MDREIYRLSDYELGTKLTDLIRLNDKCHGDPIKQIKEELKERRRLKISISNTGYHDVDEFYERQLAKRMIIKKREWWRNGIFWNGKKYDMENSRMS